MNYVHLGACIGDWDKTGIVRCGFTEFIKKNSKSDDKIFLVEANPKNIDKLKESYKNFHNANIFNLGVSANENGEITFFYTEDDAPYYMVCSTKINHVLKHYPNTKINEFKIKTISINNLFKNYIKEKNIDYLSIDLEGIDFEILMSIDFNNYNIRNISVEYLHLNKKQKKKLVNHLLKHGYSYCGFGYDNDNFDFLFRKKKILLNRFISKFLWIVGKKHLNILNYFIIKE
tara:strand:+ start:262 stop:954 length:693 start_codon:yes stop_codon:yes gene_type:complete